MFTLHVELRVKPGSEQMLRKIFHETFRPAISRQEGFRNVALLSPCDKANSYVLTIVFENQPLQQKWVATDVHEKAWSQIESLCTGYTVKSYDAV